MSSPYGEGLICLDKDMAEENWSTFAGLREVRRLRSGCIPGWEDPVAYAVGFHDGRSWSFPYINPPGGIHGLPAVILAEVVGYSSGTREHPISGAQLAEAINKLSPAEAATDVDHPNLAVWRAIAEQGPDRIAAVFVGDLNDPPVGEADRALRERLPLPYHR